jgi:FtsP/CotA-like multicopper oxidase with cupredoxin domain
MRSNFRNHVQVPLTSILSALTLSLCAITPAKAALDDIGDMAQEQAQEKLELEDMRHELKDIKSEVKDAMGAMSELTSGAAAQEAMGQRVPGAQREIHLFAREANVDVAVAREAEKPATGNAGSIGSGSGTSSGTTSGIKALTYNGKIPGPEIHVHEGEALKVVLHNNLKTPTSLHFHGLIVPHKIDGLPRAGSATSQPERFLRPEETFIYQVIAHQPGTFFYHPQIIHQDQRFKGMFGALIVHPRLPTRAVNKEMVLFLSKLDQPGSAGAKPVYLVNDKTAPFIPALEVLNGDRVRLRIINTMDEAVPLHLSGHRLEVTANNGSDPMEPRVVRDTVTVNPSDRLDVEFTANNPGVWSLASELPRQNSNAGKFPGGIALVVRYTELKH